MVLPFTYRNASMAPESVILPEAVAADSGNEETPRDPGSSTHPLFSRSSSVSRAERRRSRHDSFAVMKLNPVIRSWSSVEIAYCVQP